MICLVGKTASGKDTIKQELLKMGYESVITTTTRPMRLGEEDGVTYHYVSEDEFIRMKDENLFAEYTYYLTVHGKWYYGSRLKHLENSDNKIIILNPDGIKKLSESIDLKKWYIVYLSCSDEVIRERLDKRGDNKDEATRRMAADKNDFEDIEKYANVIVANDGYRSANMIAESINFLYKDFLKGE